MNRNDSSFLATLRDEFNAQPKAERFRTGRFMTCEAVMELLREREHAAATVARIDARIRRLLEAERTRRTDDLPGCPNVPGAACPKEECSEKGCVRTRVPAVPPGAMTTVAWRFRLRGDHFLAWTVTDRVPPDAMREHYDIQELVAIAGVPPSSGNTQEPT